MDDSPVLLDVVDLQISFAGSPSFVAVDGLSFRLQKSKTLAIVGESGSGKSLTALALMGLLPGNAALKGQLKFYPRDNDWELINLNNETLRHLRGRAISMVFQEPMSSLNPVMKIGRQLSESILVHQPISVKEAKGLAIDWLGKVKLPEPGEIYDRYPHQLSGGQKQRVMIAMAMCNKPSLLIADEPTTALDVTVQKEIIQLMAALQQEMGTAMIFITHDLALASEIADNVLVMYKGKAVEQGPIKQVLDHPQHAYTRALVACRPSSQQKGYKLPVIADFLENKTVETQQLSSNISTTNLLEVNNLRVWFTEERNLLGKAVSYYKAVDNVSFVLHKGEVLGLVGESGCGKTTISRSLMGLLPINEGQILFNGEDLAKLPPAGWKRVRRQMQLIFQDPYASLNPRMTIGDMLTEPMQVHNIVPKTELRREAQRLLDLVQLPTDSFKRYPHQFSGGQRQRIGIARALALRPQVLICDESVSALDVSIQAQILNLLKELQQEFQLTYIFISHDLNVVHYISDSVMVMKAGHIVERGEAEQVLKHPANDYTKELIEAMPKL